MEVLQFDVVTATPVIECLQIRHRRMHFELPHLLRLCVLHLKSHRLASLNPLQILQKLVTYIRCYRCVRLIDRLQYLPAAMTLQIRGNHYFGLLTAAHLYWREGARRRAYLKLEVLLSVRIILLKVNIVVETTAVLAELLDLLVAGLTSLLSLIIQFVQAEDDSSEHILPLNTLPLRQIFNIYEARMTRLTQAR